jgi:class 3 adenylate cyclase
MVSQVVRARGGSVVEFHGDGLLAVFGAPDEIPMKERAAVQVGCEIVAGMAALAALPAREAASDLGPPASGKDSDPDPKPEVRGLMPTLSVGVGIGTGPAFVGNIQSSDRFI